MTLANALTCALDSAALRDAAVDVNTEPSRFPSLGVRIANVAREACVHVRGRLFVTFATDEEQSIYTVLEEDFGITTTPDFVDNASGKSYSNCRSSKD